jgi:DNA-binding transcriptional MocR family regulator
MITSGALKIGDRLPASRDLARTLGVNRNTVAYAYEELEADALVTSQVGRGTYISGLPDRTAKSAAPAKREISAYPWEADFAHLRRDPWLGGMLRFKHLAGDTVSFAYSLPQPNLVPIEKFRAAIDRAARREGKRLIEEMGDSLGYTPLREYLATQMALSGIKASPDEILITNGCQQAISLLQSALVQPGDAVAIENPTYSGALSVFCRGGQKFIPIPMDDKGIRLEMVEESFSRHAPKLLYTIPTFQNPTGVTTSLANRHQLVELSVKYRVPVIEDDIYSELRYDGPAVPPLKALDDHGIVIHISSFSKIGFAGLRVGWIMGARELIQQLALVKQKLDLHTATLTQAAIYEFSRHGLLARHMKRARKAYRERRDAMIAALERHFPEEASWNHPEGGMALWVRLPDGFDTDQLLVQSYEKGVLFSPASHFYAGAARQNMLRLSFTMSPPEAIDAGIRTLGSIVKRELAGMRKRPVHQAAGGFKALV